MNNYQKAPRINLVLNTMFDNCPILGQRYFNFVTLPYIAPKGKKRKSKNKWKHRN